jgi:hypothetical protein
VQIEQEETRLGKLMEEWEAAQLELDNFDQ